MNQIDFKPIDDETLWGESQDPRLKECFCWPFGTLLANFYKLAKRNLIDWPLKSRYAYQDIELVKHTMETVYRGLPPHERQIVEEDYAWFLMHTEIDWKQAAEEMRKNLN